MKYKKSNLPTKNKDIDVFLEQVAKIPAKISPSKKRGRLIFAMDATASRQPAWDHAATLQGQMFEETSNLGGLDIQLAFYRGFGEFKVSAWTCEASVLHRWMTSVQCHAGETQLGKVLSHAANETKRATVNALVFVGDCCEEDIDIIGNKAGQLGVLGVPVFLFLEGNDPVARFAFQEVARLSGGACCSFDSMSAQSLRDLLSAVAVYAAGGRRALGDMAKIKGGDTLRLAHQIMGKGNQK